MGSFAIRRFAQTTEGELAAVGLLTLNLTDAASNTARTIVTQAAMPVSLSAAAPTDPPAPQPTDPAAQGCETLSLVLGAVEIELLGMAVQLNQVNLDFVPRSNGRLGILACGATGVIGNGTGPAEQMRILNTLLDTVR